MGRQFWETHSDRIFINPIGNYPTTPPTSDGTIRPVRRYIATLNLTSSWKGYDQANSPGFYEKSVLNIPYSGIKNGKNIVKQPTPIQIVELPQLFYH